VQFYEPNGIERRSGFGLEIGAGDDFGVQPNQRAFGFHFGLGGA
jgi:hypothetical protein